MHLALTTLHYTLVHSSVLHCTQIRYTAIHSPTLQYTPLHYSTLHCTAVHSTALHCTAVQYTTLQSTLDNTPMPCVLECDVVYPSTFLYFLIECVQSTEPQCTEETGGTWCMVHAIEMVHAPLHTRWAIQWSLHCTSFSMTKTCQPPVRAPSEGGAVCETPGAKVSKYSFMGESSGKIGH